MDEFVEGYMDGHNPNAPDPGPNRSEAYRHSFDIGRRELRREPPVPAWLSRVRAAEIEAADHG